ncbi:MAG TPA: hypothetical protein VJP81_08745 [Candidatus Dormibacteraeota bacterium]|nr:hypothetical protein [Candidatus Dormibacteraeota bacterium]
MITRFWKARYLRIAGMAAGAVAVAGAAVVVTASAAGVSFGSKPANTAAAVVDAKTQSSACAAFMKHFADRIHKTQAEINTAFQQAIADTLADEVKSGQITQAQADAIKKKLANQTPCTLPSTAGHGAEHSTIKAFMQQYLTAAAAALGITETTLKADLAAGQSLSQVAAAQHVSEADFRTKLIANLKPTLDKAVTDKKLTSDQENAIIDALKTRPLPLWNAMEKHPKPAVPATAATAT